MSDAKQEFIDEVMRLVELLRHADMIERDSIRKDCAAKTMRAEKRLREFLQERIGGPVEWKSEHGMKNISNSEKQGIKVPVIAALYTIPLYRLDGKTKGE